ncbi:MAG: Uncharacterized protein Greene041614_1132 [Parcubacteria group bacterium Greene0416_14]|nr:MAG: Uncharacterized protein Greene041614_1132 [Parcubacteria group bacterium Greene0416_14]
MKLKHAPIAGTLLASFFIFAYFVLPMFSKVLYDTNMPAAETTSSEAAAVAVVSAPAPPVWKATHVATPKAVKAIYMTSWVAGTNDFRNRLVNLLDTTEANALVIDIKDYTGKIAFAVEDPYLQEFDSVEERIPDIKEFIERLHSKNIYVIGRISVFQDPHFVKIRPDLAVKRSSDGGVWKDRKGISWLDAGAKEVWDYHVAIGKQAYAYGFDELNFDYIRFPSDGDMYDIAYPFSEGKTKALVMKEFYAYLRQELGDTGAILSADLFGMVTTNADDLNIGQKLEYALPYFDYIGPMVYPSHYPPGFNGYLAPAKVPYDVVKFSLDRAHAKVKALAWSASTTPDSREAKAHFSQIRPWLQDFDLGADYTADMVRAQMQATYDAGLDSWMLWDAANTYTAAALYSE